MNNIVLDGGVTKLDRLFSITNITVKSDSVLNAINLGINNKINITIEEEATLVFNLFNFEDETSIDINIESRDKSKINLNAGFISRIKYDLNINTNLYGDDILTNVEVRGINESTGTVKILMNGTVAGETKNNVMNEYAKIINKSEYSNVLIPNLIVNTNEIEANHGVSIGGHNKDEIFYLMSKGLDEYAAKSVIEEGFILSIMDGEIREIIKNILIGR